MHDFNTLVEPVEPFSQSRQQNKNIWSCEAIDTAHAQRSDLRVIQLTFTEWRCAFKDKHDNVIEVT